MVPADPTTSTEDSVERAAARNKLLTGIAFYLTITRYAQRQETRARQRTAVDIDVCVSNATTRSDPEVDPAFLVVPPGGACEAHTLAVVVQQARMPGSNPGDEGSNPS